MSNCRVEVVESQALVLVQASVPAPASALAWALASALELELGLEVGGPQAQLRRLLVVSPSPRCLRVGPHLDALRRAEQEAPPSWIS